MTCARPACKRPTDKDIHCRKCHQRWGVKHHNLRRACSEGLFWSEWPAYRIPIVEADAIDATILELKEAA